MAPYLFTVLAINKYVILILKSNQMEGLLEKLDGDWKNVKNSGERLLMKEYTRRARNMMKFCLALTFTGGMCYSTFVPLSKSPKIVGNISYYQLAYPGRFIFFNPQVS